MLTITAYDTHVEQLFKVVRRLAEALDPERIPYRIIGGLAVFLHVNERDPMAARMTRDVDVLVARRDLERISLAAQKHGFRFRHATGVDMLVDAERPRARSAVHLLFTGEKVRPEDVAAPPEFSPPVLTSEGVPLATVADLVTMKLTSYRLKDQVHIQDMDSVELITAEIEEQLGDTLRERLAQVRRSR